MIVAARADAVGRGHARQPPSTAERGPRCGEPADYGIVAGLAPFWTEGVDRPQRGARGPAPTLPRPHRLEAEGEVHPQHRFVGVGVDRVDETQLGFLAMGEPQVLDLEQHAETVSAMLVEHDRLPLVEVLRLRWPAGSALSIRPAHRSRRAARPRCTGGCPAPRSSRSVGACGRRRRPPAPTASRRAVCRSTSSPRARRTQPDALRASAMSIAARCSPSRARARPLASRRAPRRRRS